MRRKRDRNSARQHGSSQLHREGKESMPLQRILVSSEIDGKLRYMTGRVGLTANLLCRLGFCLSLEEPGIPDAVLYEGGEEGKGREFNRYTLLGAHDTLYMALLRERLVLDGRDPHDEATLEEQFKAHLCRGVIMLSSRLQELEDLADLVTAAMQRCTQRLGPDALLDDLILFPSVPHLCPMTKRKPLFLMPWISQVLSSPTTTSLQPSGIPHF
jgi:DNA sulfur modification protein DndE